MKIRGLHVLSSIFPRCGPGLWRPLRRWLVVHMGLSSDSAHNFAAQSLSFVLKHFSPPLGHWILLAISQPHPFSWNQFLMRGGRSSPLNITQGEIRCWGQIIIVWLHVEMITHENTHTEVSSMLRSRSCGSTWVVRQGIWYPTTTKN